MADYIEREAAIEKLRVAYFDSEIQSAANDPCIVDAMTDWAIRQTKSVPAADVKPVVRCAECDHWNAETHGCTRNPSLAPWWESDFCNYWAKGADNG